ncbi:MAG: DUF1492 domain-containing protein [Acutalibacteraceae bacterium]
MNYFKAAEQVLSSVPLLSRALENLKRRQERLLSDGKPQKPKTIDFNKPFTDTGYANDTLNELLAFSECSKNITETNKKIDEITDIIEQLSPEQKKLLKLWYIEKRPKEAIMSELHIESLATVYNLRNKAVAEFALLYFGASALSSI